MRVNSKISTSFWEMEVEESSHAKKILNKSKNVSIFQILWNPLGIGKENGGMLSSPIIILRNISKEFNYLFLFQLIIRVDSFHGLMGFGSEEYLAFFCFYVYFFEIEMKYPGDDALFISRYIKHGLLICCGFSARFLGSSGTFVNVLLASFF